MSQYLLDRKIDLLHLPTIERRKLDITRKGDVFAKKFKDIDINSMSEQLGLPATSSTINLRKPDDAHSIQAQTMKLMRKFGTLSSEKQLMSQKKNELKQFKQALSEKIQKIVENFNRNELKNVREGIQK